MPARLKSEAPNVRDVTEIGSGDYIKVGKQWKEVASNSAEGAERTPKGGWTVRTTDGMSYGVLEINRYAKREDLE